jgi:hypothetical protein
MADFVAVLRKTIGALSENSPEMREKVYDKARSTIEAKLAALNPQPPTAVIERQRKALEDAIAVVRAEYAEPAEPEPDDEFEELFASLDEPEPEPVPYPGVAASVAPAMDAEDDRYPQDDHVADRSKVQHDVLDDVHGSDTRSAPEALPSDFSHEPMRDAANTDFAEKPVPSRASGGSNRAVLGAVALLLVAALAGAGYWFLGRGDDAPPVANVPLETQETAEGEGASTAEELAETPAPAEPEASQPVQETAAAPEATPAPAPAAAPEEKFTQRLMPDGSEVDEGPAGDRPTIGEGTSIAALEQDTPEGEAPAAGAETAQPQGETAGQNQPALAVGQRAIFYEERTSSAQGSAEMGAIVWSVVQESPGGDLPPEPAIRAEASIPGKDVQLRMTIRRNGDQTLPAGHIIEMIFLTPDNFEGGVISNVSRIAFKETEQSAGNPLFGIPAKIADGFFLIALSDAPTEMETNLTLLRRQSWIDIPIVYQSGRRALLTLEKGIPGDRVFQEAINNWAAAASAAD